MEELIPGTLQQIDRRVPDALRFAFGIRHRASPAPALGQYDEVAAFVAALLPPRVGDPMDCDDIVVIVEKPRGGDLRMLFESCYLPEHDEDAHFVHADTNVVAVADGVGGYRGTSVDASAFACWLMYNVFEELAAAAPGTHVCPRTLLERAYGKTVASSAPAASTAAILSLAGRTLKWAYVGDSGFAVFRDGMLLHRSQAQQYYFNCPFQLNAASNGANICEAVVGELPAKEGDVVVVGTDGLFDNVSDDELERIVRMGTAMGFSPKNMAEVIAGFAYEASWCSYRDTPFSVLCRKEIGSTFIGGKPDDITVIVAFIVS